MSKLKLAQDNGYVSLEKLNLTKGSPSSEQCSRLDHHIQIPQLDKDPGA